MIDGDLHLFPPRDAFEAVLGLDLSRPAFVDESIVMDTILAHLCTLNVNGYLFWVMATRQTSASGKPKSPRIQVVLPEDLCTRLTALAESESRTVSNMAKVLIQKGVALYEHEGKLKDPSISISSTEGFRSALEAQQPRRLRGAPRRIRINRPS